MVSPALMKGQIIQDVTGQPIGKEFADSVEQGVQDLATGAVNWYQQASQDQEGYLDDALRLTAGGIKNIGNWWAESTRDQEGIGDDILRGVGSVVGTGLRVLDAGSYYGGKLGGGFATLLGVDARIGGAIGNIAGDVALGFGIGKAAKVSRAAKAMQRISPLEGRQILTGQQWGLAPGAPGALHSSQGFFSDLVKASKLSGKVQDDLIAAGRRVQPTYIGEQKVYNLTKGITQKQLSETIVDQLVKDPQLLDDILSRKLKRNVLGEVYGPEGGKRRIQGLHKVLEAKTKKEMMEAITFVDGATANAGNAERAVRMRPPSDGSVTKVFNNLYPNEPELAAALEKRYRAQQMVGFNRTKQAAREQGWTLKQLDEYRRTGKVPKRYERVGLQYDAGHWRATMSEPHPLMNDKPAWASGDEVKIWHAPTSDRAARIELRSINQAAKADIKHDINPFAAKKIGVPRTWEEDIVMWLDREFHTGKYPDWYELGTDYIQWAEDIPWDMPEKEVARRFAILDAEVKANPNHYSNWRMKEVLEDIAESKRIAAEEALEFANDWDSMPGPMSKAEAKAYDAEMAAKKLKR